MGAGIAEVFARNGYPSSASSSTEETLKRGRQHVEHSTGAGGEARQAHRGEAGRAGRPDHLHHRHGRPRRTAAWSSRRSSSSCRSSSEIFRALDGIVRPDAVLATNTSSLSVTEICTATSHPGRVIGVHFFNPAPVQNLVEIIRTVVTEPQVLEDAAELARSLRQDPGRRGRQGRLHRQRAAVRLPQPRRLDVRGASTPPARTSTPRCGSAAATRWARWRCST